MPPIATFKVKGPKATGFGFDEVGYSMTIEKLYFETFFTLRKPTS
jgi:hypothetical protein